jgi:hypothetical protein
MVSAGTRASPGLPFYYQYFDVGIASTDSPKVLMSMRADRGKLKLRSHEEPNEPLARSRAAVACCRIGHITSAKLEIHNIRNWDSNPNMLFIHLLDTAKWSGVRSFVDDPTFSAPVPVSQIIDDFDNTRYRSPRPPPITSSTSINHS